MERTGAAMNMAAKKTVMTNDRRCRIIFDLEFRDVHESSHLTDDGREELTAGLICRLRDEIDQAR